MMWVWNANLKEGQEKQFKDWLKKNTSKLVKLMPPGFKYKGSFGTVFGVGMYDVMCIWEFGRMADFDTLRSYVNPEFDRLMWEYSNFFMPGAGTTTICRPVEEWVLTEPPKKKRK